MKRAAPIIWNKPDKQFCLNTPTKSDWSEAVSHYGGKKASAQHKETAASKLHNSSYCFYPIYPYFRLHTGGELTVCDTATLDKTLKRTLMQQENGKKTIYRFIYPSGVCSVCVFAFFCSKLLLLSQQNSFTPASSISFLLSSPPLIPLLF